MLKEDSLRYRGRWVTWCAVDVTVVAVVVAGLTAPSVGDPWDLHCLSKSENEAK